MQRAHIGIEYKWSLQDALLSRLVLHLETLEEAPSLFPCNSQEDSKQGAFFFCEQRKGGGGRKEEEGSVKELQKMENKCFKREGRRKEEESERRMNLAKK